MCTVTFSPRQRGYALVMNRDEKLTRIAGLPPQKQIIHGRNVLSPSEPGGGTWISLNDCGVTFALINWHSITARVKSGPVSRGVVVNAVGALDSMDFVAGILKKLPLKKINPFRLIGIFPDTNEIFEWCWDLEKLSQKKYPWLAQQRISSGFDELVAQRMRSETFRRALKKKSAGSLDWLRRLHRSHLPQSGPFSTCMHRADAATVSCTEIVVAPKRAIMRHHAGSPCGSTTPSIHPLHLKS
jgi:Transport and Golgi organisation 2